jgi:hypothetical protein
MKARGISLHDNVIAPSFRAPPSRVIRLISGNRSLKKKDSFKIRVHEPALFGPHGSPTCLPEQFPGSKLQTIGDSLRLMVLSEFIAGKSSNVPLPPASRQ